MDSYFRNTQGFIFVFSKTENKSLHKLQYYIDNARLNCSKQTQFILVGNKVDDIQHIQVSSDEARAFAHVNKMSYIEASAKSGYNVSNIFSILVQEIMQKPIKLQIAHNYLYQWSDLDGQSNGSYNGSQNSNQNNSIEGVLVMGHASSGKTQIVNQFVNGRFWDQYIPTVGFDYVILLILNLNSQRYKKVEMNERNITLEIKDKAGRHDYQIIVSPYYYGIKGFVIVYDLTSEESLAEAESIVMSIITKSLDNVAIILVANKIDLLERKNSADMDPLQESQNSQGSKGEEDNQSSQNSNSNEDDDQNKEKLSAETKNDEIKQVLLINNQQSEINTSIDPERYYLAFQGKEFALNHEIQYIETSARTGFNVDSLFKLLASQILMKQNHF
ncbi:ras-related protein rab-3c [Stylonychia lemnae]|uniref:Ras-related protein rab-3c n=1 Tax=Stylonychia lemnae TaxID=5949 RepID=A0A078AMS7_STYLE|nr:ras-related protein rab-3c [Stylonychia lemnae]|eukprot:CDW82178.1 ras-related protein rab-3c [Stylonychia lemnae]